MNQLTKILLEKNLIPINSVFTGAVRTNTLGGVAQKVRKNLYYTQLSTQGFVCRDELNRQYLMSFDDLESVDGMELPRFARVYNIKADGSNLKTGKKRGRKPKNTLNSNNGGVDNGKNQRTNNTHQAKSTA